MISKMFDKDGIKRALTETETFDLPIISTDCAGAHEQLDERKNCKVVKRDASCIYEAICGALEMG